jgi:predicted Ser/Thr protein kinase/outer membrane protein assembly factor BamD (BamD/ComL family)
LTAHGSSTSAGEPPYLKLGRYEVVRELGKGAMGIVYLAKDPLIGRLVALKTIRGAAHADDDETQEFQQRFIREAQAAGILNHPAIVTVHDIGLDEATNTNFIAMEYVEGNNLKEVLAQGRALSFEQIGDIIAQVAEALDFAHSKGIVHRDVKPANIILLEGNRAKITDFGIAKIASGAANLTSTGQFLGTPNYMAPEQIKGAPVDGRTDIFALGICLYECLTRRKPFGGDSLTSISYKIVHEPFPPLHEINPQIPEGFEEVVSNCLAKDPAKRYQRARDMANSLRAVLRGEKPVRPAEPMLADETIVTRTDRDKQPTLEVPFPEAAEASASNPGAPIDANVGGSTRPAAKAAGAIAAANAPPNQPIALRVRKTLTNVRALPAWRRRVPPAIFVAIIALLVAGLVGTVVSIRSKAPAAPVVDTTAEARRAKERRLREEGNALLRQGRVRDAYTKYEELSRLAPRSPFVTTMMQKLSAIVQQEEISKAQLAQAKAKFDEGFVLYNEKKYPEAIAKFQESFSLNPNSDDTAQYLKLAQLEHQKIESAKAAKTKTTTTKVAGQQTTTTGGVPAGDGGSQPAATNAPAQLTTSFSHPFTDGRIIVRAGADIVANEQLFEERPARMFRRASRVPRNINVTHSLPAKNADLQVWVTVPAAGVQEHELIPAIRFQGGQTLRLVVHYNATTKSFTYEVN